MSVRQKIDDGLYSESARPRPPKRTCPKCNTFFTAIKNNIPNFCSTCGTEINSFYKEKYAAYKEQLQKHNIACGNLADLFKKNALAEVGILGHPKADKCFSLAWDYGHSAGLHDVLSYLEELSELLD